MGTSETRAAFTVALFSYKERRQTMRKLSTTQKIEASREIRMWITHVILPVIGGALYLDYKYPDLKGDLIKKFKKTAQ